MEEGKERSREELLHKIGELEDTIEVQEYTIEQYRQEVAKFVEKEADLEAKLFKKDEDMRELYRRVESMRYTFEKMAMLFTDTEYELRQYQKKGWKRYEPFGKEKK